MNAYDASLVVDIAAREGFECESLCDDALTSSSSWDTSNCHTIGYVATVAIVKNGVELGRVERYQTGDTVGVLLDMNRQSVAFFLNGVEQCVRRQAPPSSHASTSETRSCATKARASCDKERDGQNDWVNNSADAKGKREDPSAFDSAEQRQEGASPSLAATAYQITRFDAHVQRQDRRVRLLHEISATPTCKYSLETLI